MAGLSYSILIVDDSAVVRRALRATFEQNSDWYVCGEAADGLEAIEKVQELKPDLVILDVSMPSMDGLEAARRLRRLNPAVPLLMFTTFTTPTLEQEAISAGCVAIISKSDVQLLFSSIQRVLTSVPKKSA